MLKKLKLLGLILPLLAILGISVYVTLQNQDIRNKAANNKEFIQLTQAKLLKHRIGLVRVVVNDLQKNLFYRVVLTVTYTPNPNHPPPEGTKPPSDKRRTMAIRDNKTYPFLFRLQSCYFIPHVSVKLYSRQRGQKYAEVPLNAAVTTDLTPTCSITTIQPTASPQQPAESSESGSAQTQYSESPQPIQITNGEIPDDAGEDNPESQAVDIDTMEDFTVLEAESNAASTEISENATAPTQSTQNATTSTTSTATGGTLTFIEGEVTYDCSNPSSVTRHITVSLTPKDSIARLKVTSYVDVYTPKISERIIYENTVHDNDTIAVTMNQTPPSGFGNVFFAATLYFANGNFYPKGSGANVGWPYNCSDQAKTAQINPTTKPTAVPTVSNASKVIQPTTIPLSSTPQPSKITQPTTVQPTTAQPSSLSTVPPTSTPILTSDSFALLLTPTTQPATSFGSVGQPSPTSPQLALVNPTAQPTSIQQATSQQNNNSSSEQSSSITTQQTTTSTGQTTNSTTTTQQSNSSTSQSSFGSLLAYSPTNTPAPTPTVKSSGNTKTAVSPTAIPPAPFADFAGRTKAETNATPTPFPVIYPHGTPTPTSIVTPLNEQNPLVPESPQTVSKKPSSLLDWILFIFQSIIQFFKNIATAILNIISPNS